MANHQELRCVTLRAYCSHIPRSVNAAASVGRERSSEPAGRLNDPPLGRPRGGVGPSLIRLLRPGLLSPEAEGAAILSGVRTSHVGPAFLVNQDDLPAPEQG